MKLFLLSFSLFSILAVKSQERNSEKAGEQIDFSRGSLFRGRVSEFVNISNTTYKVTNERFEAVLRLAPQKIPLKNITPFLNFFCTWDELSSTHDNTLISVRFSTDNIIWGDWTEIKRDEHFEEIATRNIGELQYHDKKYRYYQVQIVTNRNKKGNLLSKLYLNFFSAGEAPARINPLTTTPSRVTSCNASQPGFVNRLGWGCTQVWSPPTTTVTHLIVHHAAGTNTSSDWGAVVLGIWNFHTTPSSLGGAGFSDIGYNWLIAPNGVLYEGRYNSSVSNIQGAHFCGTNGNTMGVCMLGDYTSQTITTAARTTLVQVLGWKACERNIDPLLSSFHANSGLTINNISGHRNGCATQCPGNTFYPDLPGVRNDVNAYLSASPVTTINGLEEFVINPNPVTHTAVLSLRLNTVKEIQYRLVTVDGRMIYQSTKQKVSGFFREELKALNGLPAATYLLQLWVNDEMVSRQLIKQ